jgi:hypothetical protein
MEEFWPGFLYFLFRRKTADMDAACMGIEMSSSTIPPPSAELLSSLHGSLPSPSPRLSCPSDNNSQPPARQNPSLCIEPLLLVERGKTGVEKEGGEEAVAVLCSRPETCVHKEVQSYRREEDIAGGGGEVGEEVQNSRAHSTPGSGPTKLGEGGSLCCARRDAGWGPFGTERNRDGPRSH